MVILTLLLALLFPVIAPAETFYISATGSNSNDGTAPTTGGGHGPYLTFAYALDPSRASCGDTLVLVSGSFGDGFSTGRVSITNRHCTFGNELIITSQVERQSRIHNNGATGVQSVYIQDSEYIMLLGLVVTGTDNSASVGVASSGELIKLQRTDHITILRTVGNNPNAYTNSHVINSENSTNILAEDTECYNVHRHCIVFWKNTGSVARRTYVTPRKGKIPGGFGLSEGPVGTAGASVSMYPCLNCIAENSISEGSAFVTEMNALGSGVAMQGSKVLGSICLNTTFGNCIFPNGRTGVDLFHSPQNITIQNNVALGYSINSVAFKIQDCVGCTVDHNSAFGTGVTSSTGYQLVDQSGAGVVAADMEATFTNNLADGLYNGFNISATAADWTINYGRSVGNTNANFIPSSSPNLTNSSTTAHGMGTCRLWVPVGASVKGAGSGGTDIGANILWRYINGVEQNGEGGTIKSPLWDPITGEFPHGADDAFGINTVAGNSLKDVHTRMPVNRDGCSFPSGYGSTGPTNPATVVASTDLTGAHIHPIDIGMDSLTVWVMVRWDGIASSPAAEPDTLTSSCGGGEDIPQIAPAWFTPAGDRTMKTFGKINPSSGTCTLTPTFTSANVSGWVIISRETDNVASYGTVAAASGLSTSPTVTASSCVDCVFIDAIATSKAVTLSAGPDQVLVTDILHSGVVLRGASSEQSGASGSVISYSLSGSVGWIIQAVPLIPSGGGGGSSAVFTVTHYRCDGLLGITATPEVTLGQLAPQDTACEVGLGGALRLRIEIGVSVADSEQTGIATFCKRAGDPSFTKVENTFGAYYVRYYGPGIEKNIPVDRTPTTKRFSGSPFQASITKRDGSTPFILEPIASGTETEIDIQLVIGNGLTKNDSVQCQIWYDNGSGPIGTHSNTITITPVNNSASMGF